MRARRCRFGGTVRPLSHSLHGTPLRTGHAGLRPEDQRRKLDQVYADAEAHVLRPVCQADTLSQRG